MKNEIYDNMLSAYDMATEQQRRNAIFGDCILEVNIMNTAYQH